MKQKVWIINTIYPLVFQDDTRAMVDFTKSKRNMQLDTYTRIFTTEEKLKNYIANNQEHDYKFVNVYKDEIEVNDNEISKEINSDVNTEVNSNTNNSSLIPRYKDHLFAVIKLTEYDEQTNGSVAAIFVSEESAKKYADELINHLNAGISETVVKSYRVVVQPIPKEDIEKPDVSTPDPTSWCVKNKSKTYDL